MVDEIVGMGTLKKIMVYFGLLTFNCYIMAILGVRA
jgi:hypothetical protein